VRGRGPRALVAIALAGSASAGCAGGTPLLHPARTLPSGEIRAAGGLSGQVAVGSIANDLRAARNDAAANPNGPGAPGSNETYARGALVAAAIAPGLAPFVAARVGIGGEAEGGITYTGRTARIDLRRSFEIGGGMSLSIGAGGSGALYGRQQGSTLPNVDLSKLRGYGADVPALIGWESGAGIYRAWAGLRSGFEHVSIENLTSEPKGTAFGLDPVTLSATRYYGGGLIGAAAGFRHVHVALELGVQYAAVDGQFNQTNVKIHGVALTPASAVWWDF
jgi:hypothetical protein